MIDSVKELFQVKVDNPTVTYEVLCQEREGVLRGVDEVRKVEHPRCRRLRRSRAYQLPLR
jgi:hypothetical protein